MHNTYPSITKFQQFVELMKALIPPLTQGGKPTCSFRREAASFNKPDAVASNPLRHSDAKLRAWLLGKTPLGSSSNDVRSVIERRGWYTDGYRTTQPRPALDPFIAGGLGGYQGLPCYVFVSAFWEFDSSNRLAGIRIQRIIDSP
jgi:hypothetical protein